MSHILWQNPAKTIALIDIPHSIIAAQDPQGASSHLEILSTPSLLSPFPSNEPKSFAARSKLERNTAETALHAEYQTLLQHAVEEVRKNHDGEWCLPRPFTGALSPPAKKRKLNGEPTGIPEEFGLASICQPTERLTLPDGLLTSVARRTANDAEMYETRLLTTSKSSSGQSDENDAFETSNKLFFANESDEPATFRITSPDVVKPFSFRIPPGACFYLGDCADTKAFHTAFAQQNHRTGNRKLFDFILLDPPWPNRSVKRTHKTAGSTYATSPSLWDIRDLILDTHLKMLMSDECLVAMWITNKPAIRDLVIGEDGIFACCDIDLVEEWLWLKTAAHGQSVTPLNGLWRKPYEVLLLGRKRRRDVGTLQTEDFPHEVKRKVIISVPDLHSRKPCLKELIEPLMDDPKSYRALEVFARHLVAGWWSWGDECIKFNWDGFWRESATQ